MRCLGMGRTFLAIGYLSLVTVSPCTRADTESPRVVLGVGANDLQVGPGMNAAGKDLRGCQFVTQDLSRANFDRCILHGVRISGCILNGVSFRGAVFVGADIEVGSSDNVDVADATVNGVWRSGADGFYTYGLDLSPQQLMSTWSYKNKDLHQCAIRGSSASGTAFSLDFRNADLRQATLRGDCSKCDFTNARIRGASFDHGAITFEQLASTQDFQVRSLQIHLPMRGAKAAQSRDKWDFSRLYLRGSSLSSPPPDVDFTAAYIDGCTIRDGLTKAQLYSTASYQQGSLVNLRLVVSDLSGCDLSGMNLTGCNFEHCRFGGTKFDDAVITGARFLADGHMAEADRLTVAQIKSTWNYKHGRMQGIALPDDIAAALQQK